MDTVLSHILLKYKDVPGASLALIDDYEVTTHTAGLARARTAEPLTAEHFLQCASLSKTVAAAFAIEYFSARGVAMSTSVNALLGETDARWRIALAPVSPTNVPNCLLLPTDPDNVTLAMLVNHTALGMHYVYGIPLDQRQPTVEELLDGRAEETFKYKPLYLERVPGNSFSYSGGGFVVLQYLIEHREKESIDKITRPFLDSVGLQEFTFIESLSDPLLAHVATGHITRGKEVNPHLAFPPFAAGALCTPRALATFLVNLAKAYKDPQGCSGISQSTAVQMLGDKALQNLGSMEFMGAKIGLGVFVARAGEKNRVMLHQAANDGFRGVYMLCFDGPDAGKGFVLLSNGDNPGVLFQCEMCRFLLGPKALNLQGIDFSKYQASDVNFDMGSVTQESIVNKGLKNLVMDAFIPPVGHRGVEYYRAKL